MNNKYNGLSKVSSDKTESGGWQQYLNRRMLILVFLGFSSGLPLFILINLVQAWLSKSGLDVKAIGLFTLVMFPYPWKFIWSPLMDRFSFGSLGRRRGWMMLTQVALFFAIGSLGWLDPVTQLPVIAALATLVAFLSASQDIVIDAFGREILDDNEQGLGAAVKVNAYKVAGLVPGALSLILADLISWQWVFWITAAFMLPGLMCTLLVKEPQVYGDPPKTIEDAVILPFREFVTRDGWANAVWILSFIFLYRLGDSMAATLATKFFIDLGFQLTQIGAIAKVTLFWGSIAGGIVGGIWMIKLGINRALWIFGVVQAFSILGFALLAHTGPNMLLLGLTLAFEAFGVGLGTSAFVAFIARTTDPRYTATQFALFTSLAAVPRTFTTSLIGYIVAQTGWFQFFLLCFLLAIPGLLLLFKVAPWNEKKVSPALAGDRI
ncbi:AmpG family muropeptide MFS transporter [Undibacterium sp. Rencai35W]|uniref:AmpG family muropeptide MFS transporter n=1 Tax=Undibacterium sp. Rencai35W TaxID=3413046 RepID=UPI003BF003B7